MTRRSSLWTRILAVNALAVLTLAGGILYLDSFRGRQIDARALELRAHARAGAAALAAAGPRPALVRELAAAAGARVLIVEPGARVADSWDLTGPTFALDDPAQAPLRRRIARRIDRVLDTLAGVHPLEAVRTLAPGAAARSPEVARAAAGGAAVGRVRAAPDGAPLITAAARIGPGRVLLLQADARDITYRVRDERLTAFLVFLGVLGFSGLLSTVLARTIILPLRRLAIAAARVRAGRERAVEVPRLPGRTDEIGRLARALADMTGALRQRIDATEAFAADVAHELKNPLASLRSATETFVRLEDPALRQRMATVMLDDVARLDRLVTGIAEASRLEAEIGRTRFQRVDLAALAREAATRAPVPVVVTGEGAALGDEPRLGRVLANLVDNAVSFSPPGAGLDIAVGTDRGRVALTVDDRGPGVPEDLREAIFARFHSHRPTEGFGRHSGLGLAIARAIVEAHGGTIVAGDRPGGGARFTVTLPAA